MANVNERSMGQQTNENGCTVFDGVLAPSSREHRKICVISNDSVLFDIFPDGKIRKRIRRDLMDKVVGYRYFFDGRVYEIARLPYHEVKKLVPGGGRSGIVNLVDLNGLPSFRGEGVGFGFKLNSPRAFINDLALASLIGAMLETGFIDFVCNGFSHADGSSSPSVSHLNGINGDFRYLRRDRTGDALYLNMDPGLLDEERQNSFNRALYKFGWKDLLGWDYILEGRKRSLAHTRHARGHHHHLHLQGYRPDVEVVDG